MDSIFNVHTQGFSVFDSFTPDNMGMYWPSQGGVGKSLVLDSNKSELVKASPSSVKRDAPETKSAAALRSHCEAERRRRERINGHLATLRNFVPCADKMDKATLLAEVINQVKLLKNQATEATRGLLLPTDADEVTVEPFIYNDCDRPDDVFTYRASVCCDYKPELIPNLRQAIYGLKLTITSAEISTLSGRVKNVFVVTGLKEVLGDIRRDKFAKSIHKALSSVLDQISASEEYSPRTMFPNKRRRASYGESSISSGSL